MRPGFRFFLMTALLLLGCAPLPTSALGVLAHEAIIDASWAKSIEPLLRLKYPAVTEADLKKAHAFAYGGAIIPDIGYYPFGSSEFSSLVHYVRSGDFIDALLKESRNVNEYAFALGVLCHYEADNYGHTISTNKAVAILFDRLRKKYGNQVTFEQARDRHARVEFGFDVLQTAKGNYASNAYHDFIGFEIGDSVLARAFVSTYGQPLHEVFKSLPTAISILRFSVKEIIPELTKDAWKIKNSFITEMNPLATEKNYRYKMNRRNYRKEFTQPRFGSIMISLVIAVLPKYGPLSRFKPKMPNPECEKLFSESYNAILTHFSSTVNHLSTQEPLLPNLDLDTGVETVIGEYKLADKAYYHLLLELKDDDFYLMDKGLKKNINAYYLKHVPATAAHKHKGRNINRALVQMNASPVYAPTGIAAY
jgi:hypothetical protein